jgi:alkenylglycerophosphocholine hydrolase
LRKGWLLGIGLAGAGLYVAGVARRQRAWRVAGKPAPALALAAWTLEGPRDAYSRRVATGLALSALGDVLLEDEHRFQQGLLAFLAAHVAYTSAFAHGCRTPALRRAAACGAFGAASYAFLWPGLGRLRLPVAIYVAAIGAMLWRAAARVGHDGDARAAQWAGAAGAVTFAASDSVLALDRFRAPIAAAEYPVIALYWLGQLGIAASARLRR